MGAMMTTKRINAPLTETYCMTYGPRGRRRGVGNVNTLVNLAFVQPREGLDVTDLQDVTPEWAHEMEFAIQTFQT